MEQQRAEQQKIVGQIREQLLPFEEALLDGFAKTSPTILDRAEDKDQKKLTNPYALPDARSKGQIWEYTTKKPEIIGLKLLTTIVSGVKIGRDLCQRNAGSIVRTEWKTSDI